MKTDERDDDVERRKKKPKVTALQKQTLDLDVFADADLSAILEPHDKEKRTRSTEEVRQSSKTTEREGEDAEKSGLPSDQEHAP